MRKMKINPGREDESVVTNNKEVLNEEKEKRGGLRVAAIAEELPVIDRAYMRRVEPRRRAVLRADPRAETAVGLADITAVGLSTLKMTITAVGLADPTMTTMPAVVSNKNRLEPKT